MTDEASSTCGICGRLSYVHLTEIRDRVKTSRSFCVEHAPPEIRDKIPFGSHRTSEDEVAFLRQHLSEIDQYVSDPALRAEFKADIENRIAEIEAGRQRLGD